MDRPRRYDANMGLRSVAWTLLIAIVVVAISGCGTSGTPSTAVMPQEQAISIAHAFNTEWEVSDSRLAVARDLDDRLAPPDRMVWAVAFENPNPGSCPSYAPGVDPFRAPSCPAATVAVVFMDATTGEFLGVRYDGL